MKILCLIPARSGSKSIPHKNIKLFNNLPLLVWSIKQAQKCKYNMRIVVSTDSSEYANIAKQYNAEIPCLRPTEISQDLSTDFEFTKHMVDYLKEKENYLPDIIVQLRPTYPTRKIEIINECIDIFINNKDNYDSLRSVVEFEKSPFKMYTIENNILKPLFKNINNIYEPYNRARQILPQTYLHNGYIDIFNANIIQNNTISGDNIYPYIMKKEEIYDIDTINDWNNAEKIKL
jgi:CMP-N-acetylneuraminic acid synthetase